MFEKGYQQFYRYTSKDWYDGFQSYRPSMELIEAATVELPVGWKHERKSNWYMVNQPYHALIRQGWKIHISATPDNGKEILKIVARICVQYQLSFKFQADSRLVMMCSGKGWSRQASGKFITIYPLSEEQFKEVIEVLYSSLQNFTGPYILSDLRYKDSKCVYYRYGGIDGISRLDVAGDKKYFLEAPDGRLVPDLRTPYWSAPYWIVPPFGAEEETDDETETALKDGRYLINYAISFSVTGGVYNALDLDTGEVVIVKEARPYTGMDESGADAVERLRREYELLNVLESTGTVPRAIDLFEEWEHHFLVQELIEGSDLGRMCISTNPLLRVHRDDASIRHYTSKLARIWCSLANAVHAIHAKGVVLGDLSIKNVLVQEHATDVTLIDFESAIACGKDRLNKIYTPGFSSPQRMYSHSQCQEDDYYSIGSIMLSTLFPVSGILDLEPGAAFSFVGAYGTELKLPREVLQLIHSCLSVHPNDRPSPRELIEIIHTCMPDVWENRPTEMEEQA